MATKNKKEKGSKSEKNPASAEAPNPPQQPQDAVVQETPTGKKPDKQQHVGHEEQHQNKKKWSKPFGNNVLGGLSLSQIMEVRPPDPRLRLSGRLLLPEDPTSYSVSEMLIIWDPTTKTVLRILGAHIPTFKGPDGQLFPGKGFFLGFHSVGDHQLMRTRDLPVTDYDSPTYVFLREAHLPQYAPSAHFAVLRSFRGDQKVRARVQIVAFTTDQLWIAKDKTSGKEQPEINRKTMRIIESFSKESPKFMLFNKTEEHPAVVGGNFEAIKEILEKTSTFCGMNLTQAISLTSKIKQTTSKDAVDDADSMDMSVEPVGQTVSEEGGQKPDEEEHAAVEEEQLIG